MGELARRGSDVEALHHDAVPLAPDDGLIAERGAELVGLVDLAAAEDPLVPGRERLDDRGARSDDVDDDADPRGGGVVWCERDMNRHPDTLVRWR